MGIGQQHVVALLLKLIGAEGHWLGPADAWLVDDAHSDQNCIVSPGPIDAEFRGRNAIGRAVERDQHTPEHVNFLLVCALELTRFCSTGSNYDGAARAKSHTIMSQFTALLPRMACHFTSATNADANLGRMIQKNRIANLSGTGLA